MTPFDQLHAAFHDPRTRIYNIVQGTVWTLIVLSIVSLVVEALLPEESPFTPIVAVVDRVLLTIFAVEIALRVISYRPPMLKVFRRPPMGRLRAQVLGRLGYLIRPLMRAVVDSGNRRSPRAGLQTPRPAPDRCCLA